MRREPVREDRQVHECFPTTRIKEPPRPVDHREQGLVSVRGAAVPLAQQREPIRETVQDLGHRHRPDLGGGEFDRQWQTIQARDQFGDRPLAKRRIGPYGPGAGRCVLRPAEPGPP